MNGMGRDLILRTLRPSACEADVIAAGAPRLQKIVATLGLTYIHLYSPIFTYIHLYSPIFLQYGMITVYSCI